MKKILALGLSLILVIGMCFSFSGCGGLRVKFAIKEMKISSVEQTLQTEAFAASFHHNIEVKYTAGQDIMDVTVRYLFKCTTGENAGTYYFEEKFDKLGRCEDAVISKPLPVLENGIYKSQDETADYLTVSEGDILDTLGTGTEVTVEFIEGGKKLSSKSVTYK